MKNEIALKTYDIDYSFLINNYLDQNLWDRQWNASGDLDEAAVEAYKDYKQSYERWLETPIFGCEYCTLKPCKEEDEKTEK